MNNIRLAGTSPVYHRQTVFYTKSINRYTFCFLNVYLPCEATSLKTNIIFILGTAHQQSYFPRTIKDWNELPSMIIESNNLQSFTTLIINYYNFVHA